MGADVEKEFLQNGRRLREKNAGITMRREEIFIPIDR
jgi:hypothetical protein